MKYLPVIIFVLFSTCLFGQRSGKSLTNNKYELGVNITRILANALVNETNDEAVDFPLTLKIINSKRVLRFGLDFDYERGDDFPLDTRSLMFAGRFGLEKRKILSDKFLFLYGIDAHLRYFNEKTVNFTNIDVITLVDNSVGAGISPILGFQFLLSDHVALEIESSITFLAFREKSDLTFSQSTPLNMQDTGYRYNVKLVDPRFLYIIVKF